MTIGRLTEPGASADQVSVRSFIAGDWRDGEGGHVRLVRDKFTDEPITSVSEPSQHQVNEAVQAVEAGQLRARWAPATRRQVLTLAGQELLARRDEMIATVIADTGFTFADASREVERTAETLRLSGEEAGRLVGELVPLQSAPGHEHRLGFTAYSPVGVVGAITPFNSPLNTVAHKLGPALAAGNGVVLKPAPETPRTADRLLSLLLECGLPPELIAVIHGGGRVGRWLVENERVGFYAFTGSTEVGTAIQQAVGLRRTQLEMGGLSSTVICADADIDRCVSLVINAGFRKAGQVCTSVQRLYVERSVLDRVTERLIEGLGQKKVGDPTRPDTFVGPLITPANAQRVETWIQEAVEAGAELVVGGERTGNVVTPAVLRNVEPSMQVMCNEIFGPVVVLRAFDDLNAALDEINDTPYGLAAGIFTGRLDRAFTAARRLRVGSVHINESSSNRVDLMPYGGLKASGHGTEGPRYAIREMSEQRLITVGAT